MRVPPLAPQPPLHAGEKQPGDQAAKENFVVLEDHARGLGEPWRDSLGRSDTFNTATPFGLHGLRPYPTASYRRVVLWMFFRFIERKPRGARSAGAATAPVRLLHTESAAARTPQGAIVEKSVLRSLERNGFFLGEPRKCRISAPPEKFAHFLHIFGNLLHIFGNFAILNHCNKTVKECEKYEKEFRGCGNRKAWRGSC